MANILSRSCLSLSLLFFLPAAAALAQLGPKDSTNLPATDLERIKIGEPAPDFTLRKQDGKNVSLSDYRGKRNVVLVFYRGHWWPYCARQLGELKEILQKEPVEILAVSVDSQENSRKFISKLQERFPGDYNFPFLEDKNHRVIDRYGLLNPDGKGWPHPATYVIDGQGIVRWKFVEVDYRKRPTNEQILSELKKLS